MQIKTDAISALTFIPPWHKGGNNDNIFLVRNRADRNGRYDRFGDLLEAECQLVVGDEIMKYKKENDHPAGVGWNQPSCNFAFTMHKRPECELAFTIESAYFGTPQNKVSAKKLVNLGRAYARALKNYVKDMKK